MVKRRRSVTPKRVHTLGGFSASIYSAGSQLTIVKTVDFFKSDALVYAKGIGVGEN